MPILLSLLLLGAGQLETTRFVEFDFSAGTRREFDLSYAPLERTSANLGRQGGDAMPLATDGPRPNYRRSGFSTMYRARDVVDVTRFPARAVAKQHRLDADGSRALQACTAQFVAARHLITASHCLVDIATGAEHAGFEIAVGWDAGSARGGLHRVTRAWTALAETRLLRPEDGLVTADRCDDLAVVEIAEQVGSEVGWLGMRSLKPARSGKRTPVLHRFAYPHRSAAADLAASANSTTPSGGDADLRAAVEEARGTEPDFSPDNLYYEFGRSDEASGDYIANHTPYVAPGRSGSALIDATFSVVALVSRAYGGKLYSCRLTPADIGAVKALIDLAETRRPTAAGAA